jgi:TPR repeat protein
MLFILGPYMYPAVYRTIAATALSLLSTFSSAANAPENTPDCSRIDVVRKDAEAGRRAAQTSFGWDYFKGMCLPQSNAKAEYWLTLAASQDDAQAMAMLSLIYHRSNQDDEAFKWAKKAADRGNGSGESLLG